MQGIPGLEVIEGVPRSKLRPVPPSPKTFAAATSGLRPAVSAPTLAPNSISAMADDLTGQRAPSSLQNTATYTANAAKANAAAAFPPTSTPEPMPKAGFLRRQLNTASSATKAVGNAVNTGSRVAGGVATAAAPAIFGSAARSLTNRAVDAAAGPEVAGVPDVAAPGQIPGAAPGMVAPAAVSGDVLRDTELGRNVGNTINALGPVAGPAGQLLRAGAAFAPRTAAAAAGGAAALRGFAAPEVVASAVQPPALLPAPPTPPNTGSADAADMAGRRGAGRDAAQPPMSTDGVIVRDGNSYSGGNVKFGADIVNKDGSLRTSGFGVSSLDTSEGYRQNLLELQRNAAERAAQAPAQVDASAGLRGRRAERANRLQVAQMNNETERLRANQSNATTLRGQDLDYGAKLLPIQQQEAMRQRVAQAIQQAGSPEKAIQVATAAGDLATAKALTEQVSAAQAVQGTRDTQARGRTDDLVDLFRADDRFNLPDPKDPTRRVFDQDGAKRAAATLYGQYGDKLAGMSLADKQKAAIEISGRQRLQEAVRLPEKGLLGGAADLVGLYNEPAANTSIPDLKDAKLRRAGWNISGRGVNDTIIEMPDGTTYNVGRVNDVERRVLRDGQNGQR